jgi:hypothetical protein
LGIEQTVKIKTWPLEFSFASFTSICFQLRTEQRPAFKVELGLMIP